IHDSDDKIAFINELLKYLIKYYPEKGIFFFDLDQLNEIDYVMCAKCGKAHRGPYLKDTNAC
ncbi:MAG: hypothetical protein Q8830_04070, partial [Candidatus Phytoplasma australasiaticum]|nr:hypothetical protein [Candidatus Phytoplasma australasiaticum]